MSELTDAEIRHGFEIVRRELRELKELINQQQYSESLIDLRFQNISGLISRTSRAIGGIAAAGRRT